MPTRRVRKPTLGEIAGLPYRSHARYRDCIGHWLMGERGGNSVRDISGRGNTGTLTSMDPVTDWIFGQFGPALDFDGSDEYVDCGNPSLLDFGTENWTLSIWIKTGDTSGRVAIGKGGDGTNGIRYYLGIGTGGTGKVSLVCDDNITKETALSSDTANDNEWHHIAGQREGTVTRVFLDGLQNGPNNSVNAGYDLSGTSQRGFKIGAGRNESTGILAKAFIGSLDDARIYHRALSPSEIWSLYEYPLVEFAPRRIQGKAAAAAGGLSIPIAAYHYGHHLGSMH